MSDFLFLIYQLSWCYHILSISYILCFIMWLWVWELSPSLHCSRPVHQLGRSAYGVPFFLSYHIDNHTYITYFVRNNVFILHFLRFLFTLLQSVCLEWIKTYLEHQYSMAIGLADCNISFYFFFNNKNVVCLLDFMNFFANQQDWITTFKLIRARFMVLDIINMDWSMEITSSNEIGSNLNPKQKAL